MAYTPGPQDYVQCPYEKSHIILIEKMQFHLTKCEYVHSSTSPMVECPFNSTHRVREIEMNYHKLHFCPDRHKLENFVFSTQETTPLHPFRTVECTSSENWDNEDVPTYDPSEHCKDKPILMTLQGVTPSERKGFRIVQRKKMQSLAGQNAEHREPIVVKKPSAARLPRTEPITKMCEVDNESKTVEPNGYWASSPHLQNSEDGQNGFQVPRYLSRGRGRGRGRGCFPRN